MNDEEKAKQIAAMDAALRASGNRDFQKLTKHWDKLSKDPKIRHAQASALLSDSPKISFLEDDRIGIHYQKETGMGFAGKNFQFVVGGVEAKVFSALFENMNMQLGNEAVLDLLGKKDGYGNKAMEVKELAKKLRDATGLSSKHLTAKQGTLTLIGIALPTRP